MSVEIKAEDLSRKQVFIQLLAKFLTRDLGARSIGLEMGKPEACEWAELYRSAGCWGYATEEEAVVVLTNLLGK